MTSTTELLGKAPPSDVLIERELIAALYVTDKCEPSEYAFTTIEPMDFFDKFHGWVFHVMRNAFEKQEPYQTSATFLHACRNLDQNTQDRTKELVFAMREMGIAHNIKWYCSKLRNLRLRRATLALTEELLKRSHDDAVSASDWMLYATGQIDRLSRLGECRA